MKKLVFSILLSCIAAVGITQVFQTNNIPYKFRGIKGDSLVIIPNGIDTPYTTNPKWGESSTGALFLRTGDSSLWGKIGSRYSRITGAAGGSSYSPDSMGLRYTGTTTRNFVSIGAGNVKGYAAGTAVNGRNIAIGDTSLRDISTGINNVGVGYATLRDNTTGSNNTAIGYQALISNSNYTTAIGHNAGTIGGYYSTMIGAGSGYYGGTENTAIGAAALGAAGNSGYNTAVGYGSLYNMQTGGSYNTAIGHSAGYTSQTGSYNVAIGAGTRLPRATGSNQMQIGGNGINWLSKFTGNNFLINASGIADTSATTSAALEINGTTGSVLLPRLNTTQTNALTPVAGMVHYNSDSSRLVAYNGSSWKGLAFTDAGGGGITTIGTISGTGNANGLSISGSTLTAHPATATTAGMVTTGAQTWSGEKTLNDILTTRLSAGADVNTGTAAIYLRNDGTTGSKTGIGKASATLQSFVPSSGGKFRWYGGGEFNNSAVDWMALDSTDLTLGISTRLNLSTVLRTAGYGSNTPQASIYLRDFTGAGNQIGIGRGIADVQFFGINDYGFRWYGGGQFNNGASNWLYLDQNGLGVNGANNASAILTANSTAKGFLPPRLTATQRNAIATPAAGLMVYDTDSSRYMLYGSSWKGLAYTDAGGGGGGSTTSATGTGISLVNGSSLIKRLKAGFNTIVTDNTDSVTISRDTLTQTLTDGATVTFSATAGVSARVTLGGNRTLSITNMNNGMYITLVVIQDGTGGRTLTLPAGVKVVSGGAGAVTLSSAANAQDILTFFEINNVTYCNVGRNYN